MVVVTCGKWPKCELFDRAMVFALGERWWVTFGKRWWCVVCNAVPLKWECERDS